MPRRIFGIAAAATVRERRPGRGWFAAALSGAALLLAISAILMRPGGARAQESQIASPTFDEKLGEIVPGDIEVILDNGSRARLADLIDRPTILSMVYYECPGLCTPLLNEICDVLGKSDLDPDREPFQLLTVSFEPRDTPATARAKRDNYAALLSRPLPRDTWRFCTADAANIQRLTGAVGFTYKRVGEDYIHPGGIVILSPTRKVVRYFYGTEFLPFDFKMGVIEAARENVLPTTARVLRFCYSFDPAARGYVFNLTRVVAFVMLFSAAFAVGVLLLVTRRPRRRET